MLSIFKKAASLVFVYTLALVICVPGGTVAAVDTAEAKVSASFAVGGVCRVGETVYFTDRQSRAVYTERDGETLLLIGETEVLDVNGCPAVGYSDGKFASASFGDPCGILPYRNGVLIADRENNVLRYADLNRKRVYTLAGSGEASLIDGRGRKAAFNSPTSLAVGDDGTIYIADSGNHAIRTVNEDGEVKTLIGNGEGSALGTLDQAQLSYPVGLCFEDGVLYIADSGNHRILAVSDGICSLVAGAALTGDAAIEGDYLNGPAELARFANPTAVTVRDGVIYVADTANGAVRVIADGYVTTLADESLDNVMISPDLFFTLDGETFVCDGFTRRVRFLPIPAAELIYSDVADSEFADSIRLVTANSLMNGTGEGLFSPEAQVTRGMIMTILARLDGMDTSVGENWYDIGVSWGMDNGITDGTNPEAIITFEQLLTMLHRFVGEPESVVDFETDSLSDYAREAACWAIEVGIVTLDGFGNPTSFPTRGECAQILARFICFA